MTEEKKPVRDTFESASARAETARQNLAEAGTQVGKTSGTDFEGLSQACRSLDQAKMALTTGTIDAAMTAPSRAEGARQVLKSDESLGALNPDTKRCDSVLLKVYEGAKPLIKSLKPE